MDYFTGRDVSEEKNGLRLDSYCLGYLRVAGRLPFEPYFRVEMA